MTPKQLAANRANAARSTGPRSPEGKARSAQNSRKHGFSATTFPVVRLEEVDEVARLRDDLIAAYRPVNSQELFALERLALAQQNLLRVERLHSGLFTTCLNEAITSDDRPMIGISPHLVDYDSRIEKSQNRNFLLAEGFRRLVQSSNAWNLFLRYQAQAERLYRRAVEEFERLKALRDELPNEPNFFTEPEANTTTSPTPHTKPPRRIHPPEHSGPDGELKFPFDHLSPEELAQLPLEPQ